MPEIINSTTINYYFHYDAPIYPHNLIKKIDIPFPVNEIIISNVIAIIPNSVYATLIRSNLMGEYTGEIINTMTIAPYTGSIDTPVRYVYHEARNISGEYYFNAYAGIDPGAVYNSYITFNLTFNQYKSMENIPLTKTLHFWEYTDGNINENWDIEKTIDIPFPVKKVILKNLIWCDDNVDAVASFGCLYSDLFELGSSNGIAVTVANKITIANPVEYIFQAPKRISGPYNFRLYANPDDGTYQLRNNQDILGFTITFVG